MIPARRMLGAGNVVLLLVALAGALLVPAADAPAARVVPARPGLSGLPHVIASPGRGPARFVPSGPPDASPVPPTRLRIPAISVDTTLETLHLDTSGALGAPKDWAHAGWFAEGVVPGEVGPAVIAGHVDSTTGPAVFYRLGQLHPGDPLSVQRGASWVDFVVVNVVRYPKDAFPTAQVYGPTPDPELRLITCSGDFNSAQRSYVDNTVVFAVAT